MKSIAFLSLFAVLVAADGSSSAWASSPVSSASPASSTGSFVAPSDVSSGCSAFLTSFNSNPQIQSCISSLLSATSSFSSSSSSSSQASSALSNICSGSMANTCGSTLLRTQLTNFYTACQSELAGSNPEPTVKMIYDNLFITLPFSQAICSKDTSGNFCVTQINSSPSSGSSVSSLVSLAKTWLSTTLGLSAYKRAVSGSSSMNAPNATTFQATGIPFAFLTPSSPSSTLCSPCAQAIMQSYIAFETSISYAYGLTNSPMLGGQKALWSAMSSSCGGNFSGSVVANAGAGTSDPTIGGALSGASTVKMSASGMFGAALLALFATL